MVIAQTFGFIGNVDLVYIIDIIVIDSDKYICFDSSICVGTIDLREEEWCPNIFDL